MWYQNARMQQCLSQWLSANRHGQILANWSSFHLFPDSFFHGLCLVSGRKNYKNFELYRRYHRNEIDLALDKLKKSEKIKDDANFENNFRAANRIKSKQVIVQDKIYDVVWTIQIRIAFITHLAIRVLMEMVFTALQYRLQMEQNGINPSTTQKDVSWRGLLRSVSHFETSSGVWRMVKWINMASSGAVCVQAWTEKGLTSNLKLNHYWI